jgi:hypothetical protein
VSKTSASLNIPERIEVDNLVSGPSPASFPDWSDAATEANAFGEM